MKTSLIETTFSDGFITRKAPEFDLYLHLKTNIKYQTTICEIHDSELTTYCVVCRRSICEVCRDSYHSSHLYIDKSEGYTTCKSRLEELFDQLEFKLTQTDIFSLPKKTLFEVRSKLDMQYDIIIQKLTELRNKRIRQLESSFGVTNHDPTKLIEYIQSTKQNLISFIEKQQVFLFPNNIEDHNNFIFLSLFDVVNDCEITTCDYIDLINNIKNQFEKCESLVGANIFDKIQETIKEAEDLQKKSEKSSSNYLILELDGEDNIDIDKVGTKTKNAKEELKGLLAYSYDKLGDDIFEPIRKKLTQLEEHNQEFKTHIFESFKKSGTLIEIEKMLKIYDDKISKRVLYNSQVNSVKISQSKGSGLTRSKNSLKLATVNSPSREPKIEEAKSNYKLIDNNITSIAEEDDEHHKCEDEDNDQQDNEESEKDEDDQIDVGIEKNKILYENKTLLKINNMFKPKQKTAKSMLNRIQSLPIKKDERKDKDKDEKFKVKIADILKENQMLNETIKTKDDCNLKISTIRRFYYYSILEFVRKNFYKASKTQSSHLFSNHNTNTKISQEPIKVFEGTNEVLVYDRVKRKMFKKAIKIDKKKFGTSTFYIGCRTFYCADKLYISGGKDTNGDKRCFWSYSLKEDKLEKLLDMNNARSFHTILYHENLRSMLVFGGENNKTSEMYDFYLNLWSPLPDLNFPRANVLVYIDKVGTFGYALCGIIGNITNPTYSDQIELLDLVDINQGWAIVDYNNKSNVDLRKNENKVSPLTEDKLLIYGANENRSVNKVYCVFDLRTFIMLSVDENEVEQLKVANMLNQPKIPIIRENK